MRKALPWLAVIVLLAVLGYKEGWFIRLQVPRPSNQVMPTLTPRSYPTAPIATLPPGALEAFQTATAEAQATPTPPATSTPLPTPQAWADWPRNLDALQLSLDMDAEIYQTDLQVAGVGYFQSVGGAEGTAQMQFVPISAFPTVDLGDPSKVVVSANILGEIQVGYTHTDWWGDVDASMQGKGDFVLTEEITTAQGQTVKIARETLIATTRVTPCITGAGVTKLLRMEESKNPPWVIPALEYLTSLQFNYDYVGLSEQAYQDAWRRLMSREHVADVTQAATQAAQPGGLVYEHYKSLLRMTGGFRDVELNVTVSQPAVPYYCQTGKPFVFDEPLQP